MRESVLKYWESMELVMAMHELPQPVLLANCHSFGFPSAGGETQRAVSHVQYPTSSQLVDPLGWGGSQLTFTRFIRTIPTSRV
jgi:hypothetical protein